MKFISIGELMVEMANINSDMYKKTYAGDTFNVAYYISAYAPDNWEISYGTSLGTSNDDNGAIDYIKSHNIKTDAIDITPNRTIGLFTLSNDDSGEKQYGYWRSMSAAKTYFNDVRDFAQYDVLYLSGITAAITDNRDYLITSIANSKTANPNLTIAYDFNHRRQLWSPKDARDFAQHILPLCNIIKISDEELPWIFGDHMTITDLCNIAPNAEIIFTKGADGSERWKNGNQTHLCPAVTVDNIVDTSAAGDSFIACYLLHTSQGHDTQTSLENASKLASSVLGYKGSIAPLSHLPKLS